MLRKRRYCECGRVILARKSGSFHRYIKPDKDHDLCFKCWEALTERAKLFGTLLSSEADAIRLYPDALGNLANG